MTEEERRDRARRGILFSAGAFGGGLLLEFLTNVAANYVRLPTGAGGWLAHNWGLLLAGLALAGLIIFAIRRFWHERPAARARDPEPIQLDAALPAAVPLIGQDGTVGEVVAQARRHGVVVVYGPAGIGASAVAVSAATELAGRAELQRYVDLRGPNPRHPESTGRSVIRVLSGFGLRPGDTLDPQRAIASIAATMRDSGMVLLLDNAERADQVAWMAHGVRGAYVVVAGDLAARDLDDGLPLVRVPPLGRTAALALLTRQGETGKPPEPAGARHWWPRRPARPAGPGNPVADRIRAEPDAAAELADRYLTFPRLAIEMGRWLAANPQVSLAAVVQDLKRDQQSSELGYIVRRQLDGTSAGARRLLGVLALAPVTELPEAAVAAMTDTRLDRVSEQLAELSSRSLVQWSRPSRCRISPEARQLADRPADPGRGPGGDPAGPVLRGPGRRARRGPDQQPRGGDGGRGAGRRLVPGRGRRPAAPARRAGPARPGRPAPVADRRRPGRLVRPGEPPGRPVGGRGGHGPGRGQPGRHHRGRDRGTATVGAGPRAW